MKLVNSILYIEFADFISAGWKEDTLWKANYRNGSNWQMIQDPKDKRKPLVQYETLTDDHKAKIISRFNNPYEWVIKEPIKALLKKDPKAETFFTSYRYNENKSLPIKRVTQYIRAAQWLTMLNEVSEDIKSIKKQLGINIPTLYKYVTELMEVEKRNGYLEAYTGAEQLTGDFATSYDRLRKRQLLFADQGYVSIIDKMYGNQLASKISDEECEAKLLSFIEDPRQFDDVAVCMFYNLWAKENNCKLITPPTVFNWRKKKGYEVTISREGSSAFNEKYIRQVKGLKPTAPLMLVEHDDNNLDFLFKDDKNYAFHRYVAIVVIDSHCGLVLGKSYIQGASPMQEQVYHAYLDAMYYIRSLTGSWYLPFELKADKWAHVSLRPFYDKVGKFVPPAHANKHRGYIEQFFGSPLWKRSQKLVSDGNYNGNNMTAKNRGVNMDNLRLNAANRPMIGMEAEAQIENFFTCLRKMPDFKREDMNAPSKEQQWLDAWSKLPEDKKRPITDEQFLLTFGIKHQPQGRNITITNRGIEPQINGQQYSYDLPEQWMYNEYIGEQVSVYYDPYDMSRVLITNEKDIRFIASTAQLSPRALEDTYTGSRTFLNAILADKKDQVKEVAKKQQRRKELAPAVFDAAAILQGGALVKQLKNAAEQQFIERESGNYESELDNNYDYNQFFNQ